MLELQSTKTEQADARAVALDVTIKQQLQQIAMLDGELEKASRKIVIHLDFYFTKNADS